MHDAIQEANRLIFEEARDLDLRRFDAWLERLHEDIVFWVPAWCGESETTSDHTRQVSLIHCAGRSALAERVARVRSGRSPASTPAARTVHSISNVLVERADAVSIEASSVFQVNVFEPATTRTRFFFGRYEHRFVRTSCGDPWLLASKRIELVNDRIPGMLDFYCV